ncbi:hypothetical protein [Flavobacterium sp.]
MQNIYRYASVSKALEELTQMGFTIDFNLQEDAIEQNPDNYEILYIYRYEGDSNPDDSAVVYGIKSIDGIKGVFVAGYSANSATHAAKVLSDIIIKGR